MCRTLAIALVLASGFSGPAAAAPGRNAPQDDTELCMGAACARIAPVFNRWDRPRRIRYGYGMTAREADAIKWYEKAARRGDARAMHNVGVMLVRGMGRPADPTEGRRWLTVSFERGIVESALMLGDMARRGTGGSPDARRAAAFFRWAAEHGDARGMHALANLYVAGAGIPASLPDAYFWYLIAAGKGHVDAGEAKRSAGRLLAPAERMRVERRARAWPDGR